VAPALFLVADLRKWLAKKSAASTILNRRCNAVYLFIYVDALVLHTVVKKVCKGTGRRCEQYFFFLLQLRRKKERWRSAWVNVGS
jgi:hypothetical protein